MQRRTFVWIMAGLVGLTVGSGMSSAAASEACSTHSLRGAYGYFLSGSIFDGQTEFADIAGAGRIVFDGRGGFTGKETDSFSGAIQSVTYIGMYTLGADCTGSATIQNSNGRTDHINLVVVDEGRQTAFVDTDPGVVLAGTFTRQ